MRFKGTVERRSSAPRASGPPGEAEILKLNPGREQRILAITRWPRIEPGSLNLSVDARTLDALLLYAPVWTEPGSGVRYPPRYAHIPLRRGEYYYYAAQAHAAGKVQGILVRRPKGLAGYPSCVELFAAINLTDRFELQPGAQIIVELDLARSPVKGRKQGAS